MNHLDILEKFLKKTLFLFTEEYSPSEYFSLEILIRYYILAGILVKYLKDKINVTYPWFLQIHFSGINLKFH